MSNPRALMVQGTCSGAGKSVLVAGLCRLAARRGIRVAPFKSQNMSLNAAATPEGLEIGRAQALQALAAGLRPTVDMNPILLKPEGERRSQIVLRGRPVARVDFQSYAGYRERCIKAIDTSLDSLGARHDLLIIEGAGSPAEINLMDRDLANMFVARRTDAEVVLVGDIDRGGVFASFVGTLALLDDADRKRVAGFIINRFRGDIALLEPGLEMLEERTGVPTLGVIPFLDPLGLPEEDGQQLVIDNKPGRRGDVVEIAVVCLPRISNHDDFLPLIEDPRASVRFVDRPEGLAETDLVILPGSKSTRADLKWLRHRGFDAALQVHVAGGGHLLGICGGYQMLGRSIEDPRGVEGEAGTSAGLDLLPVVTTFGPEKTVREVEGRVLSGPEWLVGRVDASEVLVGYEIHCGTVQPVNAWDTIKREAAPLFSLRPGGGKAAARHDGAVLGQVAGTLMHGLFDNDGIRESVLGSAGASSGPWRARLLGNLDRLADVLEEHLDPTFTERWFSR